MARLDPSFLIPWLAALPLVACAPTSDPCGLTAVFEDVTDGAILAMDECTGALTLGDSEDPARWLGPPPSGVPALSWADDDVTHTMLQGRYSFEGTFGAWSDVDEGRFVTFSDWQGTIGGRPALLSFGPGPGPSVHIGFEVAGAPDRVSVAFGCRDGERFYGLGARPDGTDHTGTTRLAYTAEQGIGQRDYGLDEIDPFEGRTGDSYYPVPWTVTDRGLGLGLGGDAVAGFSLCGEDEPGVLRVESWDSRIDLFLVPAEDARDAVGRWTLASGTPASAPDWAYGPWLASQQGTERLLDTAARARAADIPVTAIWSQDWIGGRESIFGYDLIYHWEWDEEAYPDLPAAIDSLHDDGVAFLGYFNPFVTEPNPEYDEALANGYLIDDPNGEPYTFGIVNRFGSVVDLLDEDAVAWARSYIERAPAMGQDGWMCDFAEWMPFDAVAGDGRAQRVPAPVAAGQHGGARGRAGRGGRALLQSIGVERDASHRSRHLGWRPADQLRSRRRAAFGSGDRGRARAEWHRAVRQRHRRVLVRGRAPVYEGAVLPLDRDGRVRARHAHPRRPPGRRELALGGRRRDARPLPTVCARAPAAAAILAGPRPDLPRVGAALHAPRRDRGAGREPCVRGAA